MTEQNEQDRKLKAFLAVGSAPKIPGAEYGESRRVAEFSLTAGTVEVPEDAPEGTALDFLEAAGQDPEHWEVTGFKRIEYGDPQSPFVSTRFTYRRRTDVPAERVDIEDLLALIHEHDKDVKPKGIGEAPLPGAHTLIGDPQIGQIGPDGDPFEAIENTLTAIDIAAERIARQGGAEELLVSWLGDHIEGFASQGGKNTWRTKLTLTEQIRCTRRLMYYAVEKFYPLTNRLVMAAIPGNHGRVETANGGSTRADDNFDTDALVAVSEALKLSGTYSDVEIYIPEGEQISLAVKVGGVTWGLVHGDKWKRNGQFTWWREQAFHGGPTAGADVLCAGHWHHFMVQEEGNKTFIQVPTLGTDGSYWEHLHGNRPNPGIVLVFTDGTDIASINPLRVGAPA